MTLKMDKAGRIVFPKRLRDRLGLKPDMELEAVEEPGGVLLRLVEQQPTMMQIDGLWVHRGTAAPDANFGRVVDDVRDERLQFILKAR
jgi:AbrB family looped-hinge helix DNA binding protein